MAGEVWDDSECCDWVVELGDDVCTTLVLQYDDEGTKISWMHFVIERLLDSSISDEDEVTEFQVVGDDGGSMLLFKMDCSFDSSGVDVGGECSQVRPTLLEGDSALSNEVSR